MASASQCRRKVLSVPFFSTLAFVTPTNYTKDQCHCLLFTATSMRLNAEVFFHGLIFSSSSTEVFNLKWITRPIITSFLQIEHKSLAHTLMLYKFLVAFGDMFTSVGVYSQRNTLPHSFKQI